MARLLTLGYEMDGDEYILRGWWELLRPNFGSFMGYTILLLMMMVLVVTYVFIVISNKFATFAFTCKPCPGRGYSDYQYPKVLHFLVK